MMFTYKVIIVGAGPAGISCGIRLRQLGYECIILEKNQFPRYKCCAGGITEKTKLLLEKYGLKGFDDIVKQKLNRITITNKGKFVMTVKTDNSVYTVNRADFDYWLLMQYIQLNGCVHLSEKVLDIDNERRILRTDKAEYRYTYLIGADGAKGLTSRMFGKPDMKYAFAVQQEMAADDLPNFRDRHRITVDASVGKDGYRWIFPHGEKAVKGLATSHTGVRDYKSLLSDDYEVMGAFLPFRNKIGSITNGSNVFLIGDAAGLVDSITGEGIYTALKSGEIAAETFGTIEPAFFYEARIGDIRKTINRSTNYAWIIYKFKAILLPIAARMPKLVKYIIDEEILMYKNNYSLSGFIKSLIKEFIGKPKQMTMVHKKYE